MTNYRRRRPKPKPPTKRYNINERINAQEVRVITEEGDMLGIFPLKEAIAKAEEEDMDIIEINPKAQPVIVKMMSYSKFKYMMDKAEKSKAKPSNDSKTLRVSVRISIHDLSVQARKADEFLRKGTKVKLQVQMRGREKAHPEVAKETMDTFISLVSEPYKFENEPKLVGDSCFVFLKPQNQH